MSTPKEDCDTKIFSSRIRSMIGEGTVSGFARRVGLKQAAIDRYVKCVRSPNIDAVKTIASACGVSADWLIGLTEIPTRTAEASPEHQDGIYAQPPAGNDLVREPPPEICPSCLRKDQEIAWLRNVVSEQSKALEKQAAALAQHVTKPR